MICNGCKEKYIGKTNELRKRMTAQIRHIPIPVKSHGFAVSLTILAKKSRSSADYGISHAFQLKQNLRK